MPAIEAVEGNDIVPRIFPVEGERFVLAFDREARLAAFAEGPAPYAALPGRVVAGLLAAEGLGLGLNLDVAPTVVRVAPDAPVAEVDMALPRAVADPDALQKLASDYAVDNPVRRLLTALGL